MSFTDPNAPEYSIEVIDQYIRYMCERIDFAMENMARAAASGVPYDIYRRLGQVESDVTTCESDVAALDANKVDKVTGKGLSDENYTLEEKEKLASLSPTGGGHVIENQATSQFTQRDALQFLDAKVSDSNSATQIEVFRELTKAQLDALGNNTDGFYSTTDEGEEYITAANLLYSGNKTVKTALDERALQSDLTSVSATGSTNTTGSTITSGTFFYLDGVLVRAKTNIASGATFTLNTNYEAVTAGALNWINSDLTAKTVVRQNYVNGQTVVNVTAKETSLNGHGYLVFFPFFTSASNIALDARYVYITESGSGLISSWFVHNTTNELSSITYSGNVITFTFNNAVYVTPCYLKIM